VHLVVVDRLDPRGEQCVQFEQPRGRGQPTLGELLGAGVGDLDEELIAHGAEKTFDLASALGPVRGGVGQPDPELAAGPQQPRIDVGGAALDITARRHTAGGQGRFQRGDQSHSVLGEPEPVPGHQPAVIVQERE
jgi:hypothetical protein